LFYHGRHKINLNLNESKITKVSGLNKSILEFFLDREYKEKVDSFSVIDIIHNSLKNYFLGQVRVIFLKFQVGSASTRSNLRFKKKMYKIYCTI